MAIAVVGMLDEREEALGLIKERIEQRGHKALLIDISIGTGAIDPSLKADIGYSELSELGGGPSTGVMEYLPDKREKAISIMSNGLKEKVINLHKSGELDGILAISGLTGAMISLPSMKELPFGIPKIILSSAMALPIPLLPPVTMAIFPFRLMIVFPFANFNYAIKNDQYDLL